MEWREIKGYEGIYEVSECGEVRRLDAARGTRVGAILRPSTTGRGRTYLKVELRKDGKAKTHLVHRLVAIAFLSEPRPGDEVCHNDGDSFNNNRNNLRWGTHRSNQVDLVAHGKHFNARKTHCKHGHPFDAENTYLHPVNGRVCRTCVRDAQARSAERKVADSNN